MTPYMTEAQAIAYFDNRLYTKAWDNAQQTNREKALREATCIINRLRFAGAKTATSQENEFPRNGETSVPTPIMEASAEIALSLLDGVDVNAELNNLQVAAEGYSNVKTTYERGFALEHQAAGVPSPVAWLLIKPYLVDVQSVTLIRV